MSYFTAKMHHIQSNFGSQRCRRSLAGFKGATSKVREDKSGEDRNKKWKGRGKEGRG